MPSSPPQPERSSAPQSAYRQAERILSELAREHQIVREHLVGGSTGIGPGTADLISAELLPFGAPIKARINPMGPRSDRFGTQRDGLFLLDVRRVLEEPEEEGTPEATKIRWIRGLNPDVQYLLVGHGFNGGLGDENGFKALRAGEVVTWGRDEDTIGSRFGLTPKNAGKSTVSSRHALIGVSGDGALVTIHDLLSRHGTSVITRQERHEGPSEDILGVIATGSVVDYPDHPTSRKALPPAER